MLDAVGDKLQGTPQDFTATLLLNHVEDIVNGEWIVHGALWTTWDRVEICSHTREYSDSMDVQN